MPWGGFELVRDLRRGGEADLHEVRRDRTDGFSQRAVVKVLRDSSDPGRRQRFAREARLLGQLFDPGIVRILDYGVEDGVPFQVLEYVPGDDLAALIERRGPLVPAHALEVLERVTAAVEALHDARDPSGRPLGLTHNDLAPENLMVGPSGQVKLLDLGHAGDGSAPAGWVVHGRLPYLPPERLRGGAPSTGADIFALGAMLGFACLGRPPFDDPSAQAHLLSGRAPPLPAELPEPVAAVVRRACHPDPRRRHESAAALESALSAARAQVPAADRPLRRWLSQPPPVPESTPPDLPVSEMMRGLFDVQVSVDAPPRARSVVIAPDLGAAELPSLLPTDPGEPPARTVFETDREHKTPPRAPSVLAESGAPLRRPPPPPPVTRAGPRWRPLAHVGPRGLGDVWVAADTLPSERPPASEVPAAVRVLKRFLPGAVPRAELERELDAIADLDVRGLLTPTEAGLDEAPWFLSFDYHLGRPLGRFLMDLRAAGRSPPLGFLPYVAVVAIDAVLGLGRARRQAGLPEDFLVHPSGLFVTSQGSLLIRDLVISSLAERAALGPARHRTEGLLELLTRHFVHAPERKATTWSRIERALSPAPELDQEARLERARALLGRLGEPSGAVLASIEMADLYGAQLERERAWLAESVGTPALAEEVADPPWSQPALSTVAEQMTPFDVDPPTLPLIDGEH